MPPKSKCLNPVFTKWLEEMRDEVDPDSKYWNVYSRAVKAMKSHGKYLEHPKDCAEVKFVGPKIRDRLIQRHNESQGASQNQSQTPVMSPTSRVLPSKSSEAASVESSGDEGQVMPLSKSGGVRVKSSSDRQKIPQLMTPKKSLGDKKQSDTRSISDLPPEDTLQVPVKTNSVSQTRNVVPTPRHRKRVKATPARPRLSDFVPAPAATSDVEPDTDSVEVSPAVSFEPLVFPAGSYTIQLILDEREVKSTKNRDYILNGLRKRGVNAEKRALEIGDVCWIARLDCPVDNQHNECVLDYIVERKRMDDLKSSILDGRFHEQKFRLKHTGISHVYYLVEDYDTERIAGQWREQINTSLSSTQVIDRFFLKETTSIEDTLDYLSRLHNTILTLHKDKDLCIIPPQVIKRHRFLALKQELNSMDGERTYHTTYKSYQDLNRKNGFYTLQDNMARILQCIRGLSEEKIAALLEHYPTPRSLYQAFKEAEERRLDWEDSAPAQGTGTGKGKKVTKSVVPAPEMMLAELGGQGRRKIGPALSKLIYDVFMSPTYEN
ncbi:DNA excision repair protein ERCC-4 [Ceratobasidium sp. AG-Ba]|nr:DNA excision repair protein ERCC-4 [Ceratobasidium sp. AG-Ba]